MTFYDWKAALRLQSVHTVFAAVIIVQLCYWLGTHMGVACMCLTYLPGAVLNMIHSIKGH